METKLCKHCQTEIPKKAKVCPNCRKKQSGKLKWFLLVLGILFFIGIFSGDSSESNDEPKKTGEVQATTTTIASTKEFTVGDIIEASDCKITFLSASEYVSDNQFIKPRDGYVYYRFEFEFENISKSDMTISSLMSWSCYADDYSVEQAWIGEDVLDATISSGKKAKGAIYYEIPCDSKEITLEYSPNVWLNKKIVFVVNK